MRQIKFRGKDFIGEWHYGYIVTGNEDAVMMEKRKDGTVDVRVMHYIKPETIGQFTGHKDKNGVEIYEGDIIRDSWGQVNEVRWDDEAAGIYLFCGDIVSTFLDKEMQLVEVIGNIHDNKGK